jgi:hypothetical protein
VRRRRTPLLVEALEFPLRASGATPAGGPLRPGPVTPAVDDLRDGSVGLLADLPRPIGQEIDQGREGLLAARSAERPDGGDVAAARALDEPTDGTGRVQRREQLVRPVGGPRGARGRAPPPPASRGSRATGSPSSEGPSTRSGPRTRPRSGGGASPRAPLRAAARVAGASGETGPGRRSARSRRRAGAGPGTGSSGSGRRRRGSCPRPAGSRRTRGPRRPPSRSSSRPSSARRPIAGTASRSWRRARTKTSRARSSRGVVSSARRFRRSRASADRRVASRSSRVWKQRQAASNRSLSRLWGGAREGLVEGRSDPVLGVAADPGAEEGLRVRRLLAGARGSRREEQDGDGEADSRRSHAVLNVRERSAVRYSRCASFSAAFSARTRVPSSQLGSAARARSAGIESLLP